MTTLLRAIQISGLIIDRGGDCCGAKCRLSCHPPNPAAIVLTPALSDCAIATSDMIFAKDSRSR